MVNFFKNLWNKVENFVSKHKLVFEFIFQVFLGILFIAWAIFMLHLSSETLLTGIEKQSPIHIAIAVGGYIFLTLFTYWITFADSNAEKFRDIQRELWEIRSRLSSSSFDDNLTRNDVQYGLRELERLERKLDKLIEQR